MEHTFNIGAPGGWSTVYDPHGMVVDTQASHPSKLSADSFPFTNVTAGLPTEEQLRDIEPRTLIHYIFITVHNFLFP